MISAPHNGTDTSIAAAESIEKSLGRLETIVLGVIRANGGATSDEVESITGLSHQTTSARMNQLRGRGLIEDSGERRRTRSGRPAAVLKCVPVQRELFVS